jgi:hypothetical protein
MDMLTRGAGHKGQVDIQYISALSVLRYSRPGDCTHSYRCRARRDSAGPLHSQEVAPPCQRTSAGRMCVVEVVFPKGSKPQIGLYQRTGAVEEETSHSSMTSAHGRRREVADK